MAAEDLRPKRANAGRNISKLINQELGGDDFYSSVYGGFEEDEEDCEYEVILITIDMHYISGFHTCRSMHIL